MVDTRAKEAGVAKLLKLDLQLFAEDEAPLDGASSFEQEAPSETVDEGNQAQESSAEHSNATPEVAEPATDTQPQDDKTNAAFAEMRRKAEAAEKKFEFARKYGQYGVFDESEISAKLGDRGIHTVADLDAAIEEQRRDEERQNWVERGADPDLIEEIVNSKLDNHPSVVAARQQEQNTFLVNSFNDLASAYPEFVKDPQDVPKEVWDKWQGGKTGLSLKESFMLIKHNDILAKQQSAVKQAALNNLNSKNHIKGHGMDGSDADSTQVPDDVMSTYRRLFSKELKSGKMKEADLVAHYKKSMRG